MNGSMGGTWSGLTIPEITQHVLIQVNSSKRKPCYTAEESIDIELLSTAFIKIQSLPALHLTA
jgi:hypothetical protein